MSEMDVLVERFCDFLWVLLTAFTMDVLVIKCLHFWLNIRHF